MGLFSGQPTISQYNVPRPGQLYDLFGERVGSAAFVEIDRTIDEQSAGWVSPSDFMKSEDLSYAGCSQEPYIYLGLRIDKRSIPAALLKKQVRVETERELNRRVERDEKLILNRTAKAEIKERARMYLLNQIPPTPGVADVVWDTSTGALWLGHSGRAVCEIFEQVFAETFQVVPRFETPANIGSRLLKDTPQQKEFGLEMPAGEPMAASALMAHTFWLGQEFLTWLLYSMSQDSLEMNGGKVELWTDETCGLTLNYKNGGGQITYAQVEESSEDIIRAIQADRDVSKITFLMLVNGREDFRLTLDALTLGVTGLKLPPMENDGDWHDMVLERIALTTTAIKTIHWLFKHWLLQRFDVEQHTAMKAAMAAWLEGEA